MKTIPSQCSNTSCRSTRVVPIIEGDLDQLRSDLTLLKKMIPRGAFAFAVGNPIWCCVDCETPVEEIEFRYGHSAPIMKAYETAVNSLFGTYQPLSSTAKLSLEGRELLVGLARAFIKTEIIEIHAYSSGSDYHVKHLLASGELIDVDTLKPYELIDDTDIRKAIATRHWCSIQAASRSHSKIRVRLGTSDCLFAVREDNTSVGCRVIMSRLDPT